MFFELTNLILYLLQQVTDLFAFPFLWLTNLINPESVLGQFVSWFTRVLLPLEWLSSIIQGYFDWLANLITGIRQFPIWDYIFDLSLLYIVTNLLGFFRRRLSGFRPYFWLILVTIYVALHLLLKPQLSNAEWQSVEQTLACGIIIVLLIALVYRFVAPIMFERRIHWKMQKGEAETLNAPFEEVTALEQKYSVQGLNPEPQDRSSRKARAKGLSLKELENHVIMINEDGCPLDLKIDYHFGIFPKLTVLTDESELSFEDRLASMKEKMAKYKKVVLFIHGGMNDFRPNLRRAAKRCDAMLDEGYYPIIVMWRSGLFSSYFAHLFSVRQGKKYLRWIFLLWMVPATILADVGRGLTRIMKTWYYQVITDMKPHMPFFNPDMDNVAVIENLAKETGRLANQVRLVAGEDKRKVNPFLRVVRFLDYLSPITLISSYVTWPVIDAFSKSAWDVMLRRTKTLFQASYEFETNTLQDCNKRQVSYEKLIGQSTGALAKFLDFYHVEFVHATDDDLTTQAHSQENKPTKELTIIGHSMGTIVVNKILSTIREKYPTFHVDNIVYMAAACSTQDAIEAIVPYLKQHSKSRFYNLCLHPIREQSEYHLWDFSPRGSLLEWIDSYFTTPLIATDRTFGKWENLLTATHLFPSEIGERVHLRAFDVLPVSEWDEQRESNPQFHGDFTRGEFWQSDFWTVD